MDDESSFFQNRPWGEAIYGTEGAHPKFFSSVGRQSIEDSDYSFKHPSLLLCVLYESDEEERRKGALPCLDIRSLPSSQFS